MRIGLICIVSWLCSGFALAQDDSLRARYLAILERRPEPGTVFDRLYASWRDGEGSAAFVDALRTTWTKDPERVALGILLGLVHEREGALDRALAAYDEVLVRDPSRVRARIGRARALERLGRTEETLGAYREILKLELDETQREELETAFATLLVRRGSIDEARRLFEARLERRPEDWLARETFARLLEAHDVLEPALEQRDLLVAALANDPERRTRHAIEAARLELLLGRFDALAERVRSLLENLRPGSWLRETLHERLLDAAGVRGAIPELRRVYVAWVEERADDLDAMRALARIELRDGQRDDARRWLERILERDADDDETREELARALERSGDVPGAIAQLETCLTHSGERVEWREWLGRLWLANDAVPESERRAHAKEAWEGLFAGSPEDADLILRAALLARAHELHDAAETWFRLATERATDDAPFREAWGRYLIEREQRSAGLTVLRGLLKADHGQAGAAFHVARMLEELEHPGLALTIAEEGWRRVRADSSEPVADRFALGELVLLLLQGEHRDEDVARVLDDLDDLVAGDVGRGARLRQMRLTNLRERGALEREAREVERRLRLGMTQAGRDWLWLAQVQFERGSFDAAREALRQHVRRAGEDADAWLLIANIEERQRQPEEAFHALESALKLAPEREVEILGFEMRMARRFSKLDVARRCANRLMDLRPSDESVYLLAADVHAQAADETGALRVLERGLRNVYGRASLRERKVQLHTKRGEWRAARDELAVSIEEAREPEVRLGHAIRWVECYEHLADRDPNVPRVTECLLHDLPADADASVLMKFEFRLPAEHARSAITLLRELQRRGVEPSRTRPFRTALLERHLEVEDFVYLERELEDWLTASASWDALAILVRTAWPQRLPEEPSFGAERRCLAARCLAALSGGDFLDRLRTRIETADRTIESVRIVVPLLRVLLELGSADRLEVSRSFEDDIAALVRHTPRHGREERRLWRALSETLCFELGRRDDTWRLALPFAQTLYIEGPQVPHVWALRMFAVAVLARDDRPLLRFDADMLSRALLELKGISRAGKSPWTDRERLEATWPTLVWLADHGVFEFALRHLVQAHLDARSTYRAPAYAKLVALAERMRDAGTLEVFLDAFAATPRTQRSSAHDAYEVLFSIVLGRTDGIEQRVERLASLEVRQRASTYWVVDLLERAGHREEALRWIVEELGEGRIAFAQEISERTLDELFDWLLDRQLDLEVLNIRFRRGRSNTRAALEWTSFAIARARERRRAQRSEDPIPARCMRACCDIHRQAEDALGGMKPEGRDGANRPHFQFRLDGLIALGREREARRELERALFTAGADGTSVPNEATLFTNLPTTGRPLVDLFLEGRERMLVQRLTRLAQEEPRLRALVHRLIATIEAG